jgi:hypothetical protein
MTREFIRLSTFEKTCSDIGLSEDNIRAIEIILLDNPTIGDLVQGTGGIRKLRFPLPNTGKSGGARIIYIDYAFYEKNYLIAAFSKSETENLTKAERNELKILTDGLLKKLRGKE